MAQQTTTTDRLATPWNAKVKVKITGAVSPTNLQLARNITKIHTLQTDYPIAEVPNNYTRRKDTTANSPTAAQYILQLQPMEFDGMYEWELHITLRLGAGGAVYEELVFTSTPQSTRLDPTEEVTVWTRGFTPADTNLTIGSITLNPGIAAAISGRPVIESFDPPHRGVGFGDATLRWTPAAFDETYDKYALSVWDENGNLIVYDDEITDEEYTIPSVSGGGFDSGFDSGFGGSGEPVVGEYFWQVSGYYGAQAVWDQYEMNYVELMEARGFDSGFDSGFG